MGQFAEAFERYVNAEPMTLMHDAALTADAAGPVDELDDLADKLLREPDDAATYLQGVATLAHTEPSRALSALSTFGEVLKRLVARIRRLPAAVAGVLEHLRDAVAAVARGLGAESFSVNLDLPSSFGIGLSWSAAAEH
jgi:hypothetical protein